MDEVEEKTALMPQAEATVKKARADFAQFEKDQEERIARFGTETRPCRTKS